MQLPREVRVKIDARAASLPPGSLKRAAQALSEAYRAGSPGGAGIPTEERVTAYLASRMPATYAAVRTVLEEVRARLGSQAIATVLDAGAGAGAASLAARDCFPEAREFSLVERDGAMAEAAREFLPEARVRAEDFTRVSAFPPHDLVIAAYALGENPPGDTAARLWEAARVALVVVEPGSPAGFALIRETRDGLLAAGARMLAPCPAEGSCPLVSPEWCHFGARVERSSLHRRLKDAELNYEDEKFSYVALVREAAPLAEARVIRRPRHQPGLITLETCTPRGIETQRIGKRDRERFRQARRAAWGDAFPPV